MKGRRQSHVTTITVALVTLPLVAAGCYPAAPTPEGREAHGLYDLFLVGGLITVALIWALLVWVVVRYRKRDEALPEQTRGHLPIQVATAVIPLIVVLGLFGLTFMSMSRIDAIAGGNGLNVHVWAFRWQWRFDYSDAGVQILGQGDEAPELVVPTGEPIHITLDATDVNHSFYVPAFLFKRDAIPGFTNRFDFTVEGTGTYGGQCAEFCGIYHDAMIFTVRAVPPAEFEQWLAAQPRSDLPPPPMIGPTTPSPASQ